MSFHVPNPAHRSFVYRAWVVSAVALILGFSFNAGTMSLTGQSPGGASSAMSSSVSSKSYSNSSSSSPFCPVCGDNVVVIPEECDHGAQNGKDGLCSVTCMKVGACGDGKIVTPEKCDDGNTKNNDGCSSTCQIEPGWQCAMATSSSAGSATSQGAPCIDFDNGSNVTVASKVTHQGVTYDDFCTTDDRVIGEYICLNGTTPFQDLKTCATTMKCSGGACVPRSGTSTSTSASSAQGAASSAATSSSSSVVVVTPPTTPPPACSDSDWTNPMVKGTVSQSGFPTCSDVCNSVLIDYVEECVCHNGTAFKSLVECPQGNKCSNGACIPDSTYVKPAGLACTDPDGGNLLVATSVTDNGQTHPDTCVDDPSLPPMVYEGYCTGGTNHDLPGQSYYMNFTAPCPPGTTCQNGACK